MHHLFDHATFAQKFRKLVEGRFKRYGHFEYDTEGEILRYQVSIRISMTFRLFPTSEITGTGRETSTLCYRQCRVHASGHCSRQESFG